MFDFMTAEETATKWNIPVQRVQAMCRKGRIDGAIKKGHMWFIPCKAPHPEESYNPYLTFRRTKRRLFEKAVKLFAERSYEAVTLKDIGEETGISQSAIYRHFQSKQDLLEAVYEYFRIYHIQDRPRQEDLDSIIEGGSLLDLLNACSYAYRKEHAELMLSCLRVVYQRMSVDEQASEIIRKQILESGLDYTERFFAKAAEAGRLPREYTFELSILCNMARIFVLLVWFVYPEDQSLTRAEMYDQRIKEIIATFLAGHSAR